MIRSVRMLWIFICTLFEQLWNFDLILVVNICELWGQCALSLTGLLGWKLRCNQASVWIFNFFSPPYCCTTNNHTFHIWMSLYHHWNNVGLVGFEFPIILINHLVRSWECMLKRVGTRCKTPSFNTFIDEWRCLTSMILDNTTSWSEGNFLKKSKPLRSKPI